MSSRRRQRRSRQRNRQRPAAAAAAAVLAAVRSNATSAVGLVAAPLALHSPSFTPPFTFLPRTTHPAHTLRSFIPPSLSIRHLFPFCSPHHSLSSQPLTPLRCTLRPLIPDSFRTRCVALLSSSPAPLSLIFSLVVSLLSAAALSPSVRRSSLLLPLHRRPPSPAADCSQRARPLYMPSSSLSSAALSLPLLLLPQCATNDGRICNPLSLRFLFSTAPARGCPSALQQSGSSLLFSSPSLPVADVCHPGIPATSNQQPALNLVLRQPSLDEPCTQTSQISTKSPRQFFFFFFFFGARSRFEKIASVIHT